MLKDKDDEDQFEKSICEHYMLIRKISTYHGLPTTKTISYVDNVACQMTIEEIITSKINDLIYDMMGE